MADVKRDGRKARETKVGTDSTGAEYWLVPFSESKIGHRKFVIRNSKKQVPKALEGMFTDTGIAFRAFENHIDAERNKKKGTASATAE